MALFLACSDGGGADLEPPEKSVLQMFSGGTVEVPLSPEVRSFAFENWRGQEWERIFIGHVKQEQISAPLFIHIIPGVDIDREVVYAIDGFRGAYRVPDDLEGSLVWTEVEEISEECYQILALETNEGLIPCVRVKIMTQSEQVTAPNP